MQNLITPLIILILLSTNSVFSQSQLSDSFREANRFFDQQNYVKAVSYFNLSITHDPANTKALYNRSMAFFELEKYHKALADLDQFLAIHPDDTEAAEQRGNLKFLLKDFSGSIEDYNKTLRKNPSNVVYVNRACAKLNLRQYQDALEDIDEALALAPNDFEANVNRADILFELGKYQDALNAYTQALQLSPDDIRILNNRGNCYFELGVPDRAMADYTSAIEKAGDSGSFVNRGYLELDRGNIENASMDCIEASIIDPNNSDAFNCIGLTKQAAGQLDEAMNNFDKAVALHPRNDFFINRGKLYFQTGSLEDALMDFEHLFSIDKSYPGVEGWILKVHEAMAVSGVSTEEEEDGDDFLDDEPANENLPDQYSPRGANRFTTVSAYESGLNFFLEKAFKLSSTGQYGEALELFNKVIRNNETIAEAFHGRAIVYTHLNHFDLAIQDFTTALRLDNNLIASRYNRAIINYDLGKFGLAQRDFTVVLSNDTDFGNTAMLWQECDLIQLNLR